MTSTTLKSNTSVCPRCGTGLRCAMVAGDRECWCVHLPHVMPLPSARTGASPSTDSIAPSCFCPACLKQIIDERQNTLSAADD